MTGKHVDKIEFKVKSLIARLGSLKEEFVMSHIGVVEHYAKVATILQMIDEARQPVADKALKIWLDSAEWPACGSWLRAVSAEKIPLWGQPFIVDGGQCFIDSAAFDLGTYQPVWKLSKSGNYYAAGIAGIGAEQVIDKLTDAIGEGSLAKALTNYGAPFSASIMCLFGDDIYPLRRECADAAWFLLEYGLCDWYNILQYRPAYHIVQCAKDRLEVLDARRQPIADAAQILFTVFGVDAKSFYRGGMLPVESLPLYLERRKDDADKAEYVYFKRPGVPRYIQSVMMAQPFSWIEREYKALLAKRRIGTRITVLRLGSETEGSEFSIEFAKAYCPPHHTERFSGKVSGGSGGYERIVDSLEYDEYRVVGDACVTVEAVWSAGQ